MQALRAEESFLPQSKKQGLYHRAHKGTRRKTPGKREVKSAANFHRDFLLQILRMKVLFIGGTGIISTASTALAVDRGIDITLLTRGKRDVPRGVRGIAEDVNSPSLAGRVSHQKIHPVAGLIAFTPED